MNKPLNPFRTAFLLLSVIGFAIALYLAYAYMTDTPVRCSATGVFSGCEDVQHSTYAQIFGVPIPLYGLLFYVFVLVDQLLLKVVHQRIAWWNHFFWAMTFVAFLFSVYLTSIEAFVLHAWCIWCVWSAIVSTALFAVASLEWYDRRANG